MLNQEIRFIPAKEARAKFGLGPTAWADRVKGGAIPPPLKNGKLNMWLEHELNVVLKAHVRGFDKDAIRLVVADLVAKRAELAES